MNFNATKQAGVAGIICGICGEDHQCSECNVIEITGHVSDNVIPTRARLTLPDAIDIKVMADGTSCVIASKRIERGTRFGPLEAQKLLTLSPSIVFPIKLFSDAVEELSEYYLDTSDENNCNWMIFVAPAQNIEEQNMICFQEKSKIYFVALKNIEIGEFLKIWYSPYYAKRMKKNVLTAVPIENDYETNRQLIDLNELLKKQQKIMERDNWTCKFCGKLENDVTQFATHILEHYQKYRKFKKHCDVCKQTFPSQRMLRKHLKTAHSKENEPNNTKKCKATDDVVTERIINKDALLGGPLLNDLLNDSTDNSNLVLPSIELNQLVIPVTNAMENQGILLENDSLSLNVDNLLTENVKELDHFNFEIGESQEQHVCDICLKAFSKLDYLIQHLKKHTGKFTCQCCLKIFCRGENLNAHKCNNNVPPKFTCSLCQRGFMLKKYLMRHVNAVHNKQYTCENCNRQYHSRKEYKEHNCPAIPAHRKATFTCVTCNKIFFRDIYLRKHMKTHTQRVRTISPSKHLICEFCGQQFSSIRGLHLHKKIHLERTIQCKICEKKFYRQDVLDTHMLTHGEAKETCSVCHMKLRTKQTLAIHMLQHTGVKPHACKMCTQTFYQRSTLIKHYTKVHLKTCQVCKKSFDTVELLEKHKSDHLTREYFECPLCNKILKLRSSLRRHLKQFHGDHDNEALMSTITPKEADFNENQRKPTEGNFENKETPTTNPTSVEQENFESIVDNFETIINSYDKSIMNPERILDFNDFEMDLETNFESQGTEHLENREICLSMPDLTESDQEITLGENAYMLENGTIVEQKDQGNVLVYVLGKKILNGT